MKNVFRIFIVLVCIFNHAFGFNTHFPCMHAPEISALHGSAGSRVSVFDRMKQVGFNPIEKDFKEVNDTLRDLFLSWNSIIQRNGPRVQFSPGEVMPKGYIDSDFIQKEIAKIDSFLAHPSLRCIYSSELKSPYRGELLQAFVLIAPLINSITEHTRKNVSAPFIHAYANQLYAKHEYGVPVSAITFETPAPYLYSRGDVSSELR